MFGMGPTEMFLALVVVLLLFGAKRIPEIGRSIGKGIQEFKRGMKEVETDLTTTEKKSVGEGSTEEHRKS